MKDVFDSTESWVAWQAGSHAPPIWTPTGTF